MFTYFHNQFSIICVFRCDTIVDTTIMPYPVCIFDKFVGSLVSICVNFSFQHRQINRMPNIVKIVRQHIVRYRLLEWFRLKVAPFGVYKNRRLTSLCRIRCNAYSKSAAISSPVKCIRANDFFELLSAFDIF